MLTFKKRELEELINHRYEIRHLIRGKIEIKVNCGQCSGYVFYTAYNLPFSPNCKNCLGTDRHPIPNTEII